MSSSGVLALMLLLVAVATAAGTTHSLAIVRLLLPWMVLLLLVSHVRMLSGPFTMIMLLLLLKAAMVLLLLVLWVKATVLLSLLLVSLVILIIWLHCCVLRLEMRSDSYNLCEAGNVVGINKTWVLIFEE